MVYRILNILVGAYLVIYYLVEINIPNILICLEYLY